MSSLPRIALDDPEITTLSPGEAAFVADVSRKTVDQAIDRKEILPLPAHGRNDPTRALSVGAAVYLRLREEAGDLLSARAKQQLVRKLSLNGSGAIPDEIDLGPIRVRTARAVGWVRKRLAELRSCREMVVSDPAIRAGEPVVRGTRIPVHMLGEMAKQGASTEELLASYPALTPETLEAALLYARLYPQRGRPRAAPWRKNPPRKVFAPEDLP